MHFFLKLVFLLFNDTINRQTKLKIKPHLKMQGSKRTSVLLKPGTRPGRRGACSLAMFITYFWTFSTVSERTVGGLCRCEIPHCCHVCGATHHRPSNVLQGCKTHFFWWNVKTKMSSCKFSYRGRKRTFAEVCSSSVLPEALTSLQFTDLWIAPKVTKASSVEDSSRQFNFFKMSLIVIPQLHACSSSPHLHWRVWIERIDFCLFRQVCFRAINVKLFIFIGFRVTFGAAMVIWCKASLFIIITISSLKDSKYNLVT